MSIVVRHLAGPITMALTLAACGGSSQSAAVQRADDRAAEEQQEAMAARADALKAHQEAADAEERAREAEHREREAEQQAQIATQQADREEWKADRQVVKATPVRVGATELQPETTVLFAPGSATLSGDAMTTLRDVAKSIRASGPDHHVVVAGYADAAGAEGGHLALSRRRADTVANTLVSLGVPSGELVTKAFGASHPISSDDTERGRALNRRVEIAIRP